jgi:hypothetical protein
MLLLLRETVCVLGALLCACASVRVDAPVAASRADVQAELVRAARSSPVTVQLSVDGGTRARRDGTTTAAGSRREVSSDSRLPAARGRSRAQPQGALAADFKSLHALPTLPQPCTSLRAATVASRVCSPHHGQPQRRPPAAKHFACCRTRRSALTGRKSARRSERIPPLHVCCVADASFAVLQVQVLTAKKKRFRWKATARADV